jgi:hypothetical protein
MIFGAAFLISIGVFLAYLCRKELILAWASRRWPHTTGQVSGSVVHEGITQGMTADGTLAPMDKHFREIDLVFSYSVAGQSYQSSRFSFSAMGWQENTRYYNEGDEVTVYYCPATPSIAVLQPGLKPGLLAGPVLVALGLVFLVYGLCTQ